MATIDDLFRLMVEQKASDLHITQWRSTLFTYSWKHVAVELPSTD